MKLIPYLLFLLYSASTLFLIAFIGVPYNWPFFFWDRTPLNGTRLAFLMMILLSFAAVATLLFRRRVPPFIKYSVLASVLSAAVVWSFQEILFDRQIGIYEIDTSDSAYVREPELHPALNAAYLMEEYLNNNKSSAVADRPFISDLSLIEKVRKSSQARSWRSRFCVVLNAPHNDGYIVLLRLDDSYNDSPESLAAEVAYKDNRIRILGSLLWTETHYFVRPKFRSISKSLITSYGLFRAYEDSKFRFPLLISCLLWSLVGLWRLGIKEP